HGRGDCNRADGARDALRSCVGCGALDRPRGLPGGSAQRATGLTAAIHRARPQGDAVSAGRPIVGGRALRRRPSPALIVALVALVFSTTGLADAARRAVGSAGAGHPISPKPRAGGVLLLGKNRKFPAAAIPTVKNANRVAGKT